VVRRKLIKKYNTFYSHWIDYCILVSGLAMTGLLIAVIEWDQIYPQRFTEKSLAQSKVFSTTLIISISILGVIAIVIKYRLEATWRNYNNPIRFYRSILRQQVNVGLIDKSVMNLKDVHRENPFVWMMSRPLFWFEVVIMLISPLPMSTPDSFFGFKIVQIPVINWVDYSGRHSPGSYVYDTPYLTNDFFLAAMFSRFFFLLQTVVVLSRPNNQLVGKRVCFEQGIEPNFSF